MSRPRPGSATEQAAYGAPGSGSPVPERSWAAEVAGAVHGGVAVTGRLKLDGALVGPLEVRLDGQADVAASVNGDVQADGPAWRGTCSGQAGSQASAVSPGLPGLP